MTLLKGPRLGVIRPRPLCQFLDLAFLKMLVELREKMPHEVREATWNEDAEPVVDVDDKVTVLVVCGIVKV